MSRRIADVRVEGVTKVFGPVRALASVSFELGPGDSVAVMGPNGAGKSTLLALLSLATRPTRGRVLFGGEPGRTGGPDVRARIGLLSHDPLVYPDLTGRENLVLFARLHGVADPSARAADLEEELALGGFAADRPVRALSRGQLQRVALARALVGSPDLLLLDEPAAGLDTAAVSRIEEALLAHRERGGISVLVTHEPDLAARIAGRAIVLMAGRVAVDAPAPEGAAAWREMYVEAVEGGGA